MDSGLQGIDQSMKRMQDLALGSKFWQPYSRLVHNRNFTALLASTTSSSSGSVFFQVALAWLIFQASGSAFAIGLLFLVQSAPNAVLGLVAGAYLDRWSKRDTMMYTYGIRAILVLSLAFAIYFNQYRIPLLYAFVLATSVASTFSHPARHAIIPDLVQDEELPSANALIESGGNLVQFLMYGLSVVALLALGAFGTILLSGLSFIIAAIACALIVGVPSATYLKKKSLKSDIHEGAAFVFRNPTTRDAMITLIPIDFFFAVATAFPIVYAATVLHMNTETFGLLLAALTLGQFIGYLPAASLVKGRSIGQSIFLSPLLFALAAIGLGINRSLVFGLALFVLAGASMSLYDCALMSYFQAKTPRQLVGRVISTYIVLSLVAGSLAGGVAGYVTDLIGLPATFLISGLSVIAVSAVLFRRQLRKASY